MEHPKWEYDVFLSFAGKDTRLNFTDHLYDAFIRSGIRCFRDDVDLEKGEDIKKGLFQAIQDSLCAVLIISENYAESSWCLQELENILESREKLGRRVIPIFYDINPGDVKHLRESFGKGLAKHEKEFIEDKEKVENWRKVLSQIGSMSGEDTRGRHEVELIKKIVGDVWSYLSSKLPSDDNNLVGIDSRVADMMAFLEVGLDDKRSVGIWGMGGLGKTTLARVVFEKLSHHKFEVCCFFEKVGETLLQEHGLVSLQKSLLSHLKIQNMEIHDGHEGKKMIKKYLREKKVLLVLDDLDDTTRFRLRNLIESPDWFGKGSRIIITTRDSHLLIEYGVDKQRIYPMETMKEDESLKLFSKKAFHEDYPEDNYLELSKSVVKYAGGLPLALEVLGSFLFGRSEAVWRSALNRLKQIPDDDRILKTLKISYEGLTNVEEKIIFLDIACFFKGWRKKEVTLILESCDLNPTIGIEVLIERSLLVETENCRLEMHDLLVDLGRSIDRRESPNVGKHSRLWKFEDIKDALENNIGCEAIQAIVMQDVRQDQREIKVHPEAFLKMSNIRLLILNTKYYSPLILPRGSKISRALKVIRWPSFPLEAFPLETPLDKLDHIEMDGSQINQLWNGVQFMNKLKFMNLSNSSVLTETPDFSKVPYLQHLCLSRCRSLVKIHPSLWELKELAEVYLRSCENLEILPTKLETNSLIKLDLSWCKKVAELPEFGEGMKRLSYLDVSYTAIARLPESLVSLTGLRDLDLRDCKILNFGKLWTTHITRQISGFNVRSLRDLDLSYCGLSDGSIPDNFGSLSSLIALDISGNDFVNLPTGCFSSLFRLLFLSLHNCKRLKSLPRLPPRLIQLKASYCDSMEPVTDRHLENLVASLDHECRGRTKYVISDEECYNVRLVIKGGDPCLQPERLPLRDFCATIPGSEVPSWFPNKEYYPSGARNCVMKVNIPGDMRDSEWSGIVLCLHISNLNGFISWSSKAPEDDHHIFKEWAHFITLADNHLCMMVLELNEKTCWQHLRAHNNSLHILISIFDITSYYETYGRIWGCGWRVICREDIREWCHLKDSNQLAAPDEVNLPWSTLEKFTGNVLRA